MSVLFYFHGGDLPSWLIDFIFYSIVFIPVVILFGAILFTYKFLNKDENKGAKHKKEKQ